MPSTVSANARTVVHKGSGDPHLVFPDVCKTPPIPLPIPYPNLGVSADTTLGAITVTVAPLMASRFTYPGSTCDLPISTLSPTNLWTY